VARLCALIVDDSAVTRALVTRTLVQAGFDTLQAGDGAEAAVIAFGSRPDVIVTDIEMPTMDGYQLLHLLKSDPATAHIPVLVLTSHGEAPSRFWGVRTGADAYLTKDHEPEELIETIGRLVEDPPAAAANASTPPQGPLEIVARVARHLDASLFQATLANTILERGMLADDLGALSESVLAVISEIADVHALALATAEPDAMTVHVLVVDPLEHAVVGDFARRSLEGLSAQPGATIEVTVHGELDGSRWADVSRTSCLPLPLRDADGVLAVLPRDSRAFAQVSHELVEGVRAHLALVLDNTRLSQRLRELSTHDSLTRVLNHRAIHDRLAEEIERARRYKHPLAVVLCDLDHFKRINDTYGHLAGDAALRDAALVIRQHLRTSDAFGRYGGEEFLAVLPENDLEAGRHAAERLRAALAGHHIELGGGDSLVMTGSFGVAARSQVREPVTADALVSLADARLYDAKRAGRDCVRP
jgi:two-component system cell cycle response regulator